jgi:dTMP kinase
MLSQALSDQGYNVQAIRFPDRTSPLTGPVINAYLAATAGDDQAYDHTTMQLLFAANRREKEAAMTEALSRGTTLIVDRYTYSGVAYGSALGIDPAWSVALDAGLLVPDTVFFLDLPDSGLGEARGGFGKERYETTVFQERVCQAFKDLRMPGQQLLSNTPWHVVDARMDIKAVHAQVLAAAEAVLKGLTDKVARFGGPSVT